MEDYTEVLELQPPEAALERARALIRRGSCLCRSGMVEPGLRDLHEAVELEPAASIARVKRVCLPLPAKSGFTRRLTAQVGRRCSTTPQTDHYP